MLALPSYLPSSKDRTASDSRFPARFILGILLPLSIMSAVFGIGLSQRSITPLTIPSAFQGVSRDTWLQDGAEFYFPTLTKVPHVVTISFNNWQANNGTYPTFNSTICDSEMPAAKLTPENLIQKFHLPANCRSIRLNFPEAPVASPTDNRKIGAQFTEIRISSALGVPLFQPDYYLSWSLLTLIASILTTQAAKSFGRSRWLGTIPIFAFAAIESTAQVSRYGELAAFIITTCLVLLGFAIRSHIKAAPLNYDLSPTAIRYALLVVVAIGFSLRLYGIAFGLPELFHTDEGIKQHVMEGMIKRGSLNPRYFLHPTLLLYLSLGTNFILSQFQLPFSSGELLILSGRFVSAIAGTLSIVLVYGIGAQMFTRTSGLLASMVLATAPLSVTCSRYLKEDSLFTMLFLLVVWLTIIAARKNSMRLFLLAGLSAGLCASAKYTGALSIVVILAAPWLSTNRWKPDISHLRMAIVGVSTAPLGFLLGTPFAILTPARFLAGVQSEHRHMLQGHHGWVDPWSHFWMYHLSRSLPPGLTVPVMAISLVSIGYFLRRPGKRELFLIFLLLLIYLPSEWVRAKPAPQPERYILACIPVLCLFGAEFLQQITWAWRPITRYGLFAAVAFFPLLRSVQLATELSPDTRIQMSEWITKNLDPSSKLLIEGRYAPKLKGTSFKRKFLSVKEFYTHLPLKKLRQGSYDYLLITSFAYDRYFSQAGTDPNLRRIFSDIFRELKLAKEFNAPHGSYGFHNPTIRLYTISKNGSVD